MKETNMEHYRGEIEEVKYNIAIKDGEIVKCEGTCCNDCDFFINKNAMPNAVCADRKIKWLMSEYKSEPVLTQREKHFVEFVQTGYIARDKDGRLDWYECKPYKTTDVWYPSGGEHAKLRVLRANEIFPFITWEDEEPWSVADLRKLKVKEHETYSINDACTVTKKQYPSSYTTVHGCNKVEGGEANETD